MTRRQQEKIMCRSVWIENTAATDYSTLAGGYDRTHEVDRERE
jgi:hypothetical protein